MKSIVLLFVLSSVCLGQSLEMRQPQINLAEVIAESQDVKDGNTDLIMCFSNADFKASEDLSLLMTIDRIQKSYPDAVEDRGYELCVNNTKVDAGMAELKDLHARFGAVKELKMEIVKPMTLVSSSETNLAMIPKEEISIGKRVILTLRAAAEGALGALVIQKSRPALDYLSNKGRHQDISISGGAVIGIVTDVVQRLNGETDEKKIAVRNFGASLIGSMLQTRDPNVVGLAVVLTLSQVPFVQDSVEKLAQMTPEKLDWQIPAVMVGAFYLMGRHRKGEQWTASKDKVLQGATFGALAAAVTATHKGNETTGFIVASAASLLDELCDATLKQCQGRFSLADLAANTMGAYLGAKVGGLVISKTQGGAHVIYHKQW